MYDESFGPVVAPHVASHGFHRTSWALAGFQVETVFVAKKKAMCYHLG